MGGIVWLASYPKSGNTWTRNFLHNLLYPADEPHDINRMSGLTTYEIAERWYAGLLPPSIPDCSTEQVAAVRAAAQQRIADNADGLVFVKTHNALGADHGRPLINSKVTAGAVYIVRNPLDVAVSYRHHLGTDLDDAILRMGLANHCTRNFEHVVYELMGSWSQHVESWTRKRHRGLHVMRYEDMRADPMRGFGGLAEFLLLSPSKAELARAIEASSFDRLREMEEAAGFFEKPEKAERFFRKGKVDEWRDVLSDDQVRRIVTAHRDQMARFGYVPEGY
jgi:hypothetical protein